MATERYAENLVDAVCDDDRVWFEQHPQARRRLRHFVPGEVAPIAGAEFALLCECGPPVKTMVMAVGPGTRARQPLYAHDFAGSGLLCKTKPIGLVTPRG